MQVGDKMELKPIRFFHALPTPFYVLVIAFDCAQLAVFTKYRRVTNFCRVPCQQQQITATQGSQQQRAQLKMKLMNENRRKKIEGLREREQLREYRSRLQSMLMQKLVGKYGERDSKGGKGSSKNQVIKDLVKAFMQSTPSFSEDKLAELEKQVQQKLSAMKMERLTPVDAGSSMSGGGDASAYSAPQSRGGNAGASMSAGAAASSTSSAAPAAKIGPNEDITEKFNAWTLLDAMRAEENESDIRNNIRKKKTREANFRKELDDHTKLVNVRKAGVNADDGEYLRSQDIAYQDWKANEKAKHDRVERLIMEEKAGREVQIKYKNDLKNRTKAENRARENQELAENDEAIRDDKARLQRMKENAAERMRLVKIENEENKKVRLQRKREDAEYDQKLMREYAEMLDRQEWERENAFKLRMDKLEASSKKSAEEGAAKEDADRDLKIELKILREAAAKDEADQERERRDKQALKDKAMLMLRSNQKLMDAEMDRRAAIKQSDDKYAAHVKKKAKEFFQEEGMKKATLLKNAKDYERKLKEQIDFRAANQALFDPNKVSMSKNERGMNEVELSKLKTNPELRQKVIGRLMAKSSPSKPRGGGLGIGSG